MSKYLYVILCTYEDKIIADSDGRKLHTCTFESERRNVIVANRAFP